MAGKRSCCCLDYFFFLVHHVASKTYVKEGEALHSKHGVGKGFMGF